MGTESILRNPLMSCLRLSAFLPLYSDFITNLNTVETKFPDYGKTVQENISFKLSTSYVGFEVVTAVVTTSSIFCGITPCGLF
jgi:hypothetical protein